MKHVRVYLGSSRSPPSSSKPPPPVMTEAEASSLPLVDWSTIRAEAKRAQEAAEADDTK